MTAAPPSMLAAPPATRRIGAFRVDLGEAFIIASREDDPEGGTFVYPRLWQSDDAVYVNWHFDRDMLDRILPTVANGRVSRDGGRTWQRQTVLAPPGYKTRTGPGEITSYWHCFEMPAPGNPGTPRTPGQRGKFRIATFRSTDNARSWGPLTWTPIDLPGVRGFDLYDPPQGYKDHSANYKGGSQRAQPPDYMLDLFAQAGTRRRSAYLHTVVKEPDGTLLALLLSRWLPGGDELDDETFYQRLDWSRKAVLQARSRDGGRSWTLDGPIAFDAQHRITEFDEENCFSEPAMAIYPDGYRVCVLRVGSFRPLHVIYSEDSGRTWSEPAPLAIRGVDPHLVAMPSGMLVLATGRPDLTIHFSLDRGRTWSHSETLFACERRGGVDPDRYTKSTCNPGLVPVSDDTLLYVHDVSRFDASQTDHWLQRAGFARVIGRHITVRRSVRAAGIHAVERALRPLTQALAAARPQPAEPQVLLAPIREPGWSAQGGPVDQAWRGVAGQSLVDVQSGAAVAAGTSFQAGWCDAGLCLAVRCDEPDMARLHATLAQQQGNDQAIWTGDNLELLVRTQAHSYYQIVINVSARVVDVDRSNGIDLRWQSHAQCSVRLDERGWSVQVLLPIAAPGAGPGVVGRVPTRQDPWFINLCRQRPLDDRGTMELSAFVPTGEFAFHQTLKLARCFVK
jgi:hypothetical protein